MAVVPLGDFSPICAAAAICTRDRWQYFDELQFIRPLAKIEKVS
jgi:hypothetical protein